MAAARETVYRRIHWPSHIILALLLIPRTHGQIESCPFNMLCTCKYDRSHTDTYTISSMSSMVLKDLVCAGVPFARIPALPPGFILQMDIIHSGIEVLNTHDFGDTQVQNLRLMSNKIRRIADDTFSSMNHSLISLDLSANEFTAVPRGPLSRLSALEWLNLQRNHIAQLHKEDWTQLQNSLSTLFLGHNDFDEIPPDVFRRLWRLLWLNLEDNNIQGISEGSLPTNIQTLNLDRNLLTSFPMSAIGNMKTLFWLLLRGNLLDRLPDVGFSHPKTLEKLDLGENFIRFIPSSLFNGTLTVRDLYLDFNLLTEIQDGAFKGINPGRLYLSANNINNITDGAFKGGPQKSIVMLDLDKNSLSEIPKALSYLSKLKYLYIPNNNISKVPSDAFRSFCDNLEALSLAGNNLSKVPHDALENCTALNHLNLGHNRIEEISAEDFQLWGDNLETLILRNNRLYTIPANAFRYTPKLNELSLSFNRILDINPESFIDVLNTLEILEMSFGFYRDDFPEDILKPLTALKWIALDNNNFRSIAETSLYSFGKLAYFNMDFNRLTGIPKTLFHQNVHKNLADIRLAYNFLTKVAVHTFYKLSSLRNVVLNGNKITSIQFEAFKSLPSLATIMLSDNQIHTIDNKAFSHLPNFMELDLQKNNLRHFSLSAFANCTQPTAPLTLNLSFNQISDLYPGATDLHVKSLDLSHNHLKEAPINFLQTFTHSLQKLFVGYNRITKLDSSAFGNLNNLQLLVLHHNTIQKIRPRAFSGVPAVQSIDLSHNHLEAIPHECFTDIPSLRTLDLSHNHIRSLTKSVLSNTLLETLQLSYNEFISMPTAGLYPVATTLHYLDISHNHIEHLDSSMFHRFNNLIQLKLSHNKLTILPDNVFVSLSSLLTLDLSANPVRANFKELFHYTQKIQNLNLAHIGFTSSPIIPLPNLVSLNMSHNLIQELDVKSIEMLKRLRFLDLSHNSFRHVPTRTWSFVPFLKHLDLSSNPIKSLTKDSFAGANHVESLVLKNLDAIKRFDSDALVHMRFLRELHMNTFPHIEKYRFRVGHLLATVHTLQRLCLEVREAALTDQLSGAFGPKLKELHITGTKLMSIDAKTFRGFQNKHKLLLSITDTSVSSLPDGLLAHLSDVAYLSLDLRRNKLKYLNAHVLYQNGSDIETKGTTFVAGGLALQGNDWACDCSLVWLGQWLRRWLRETLQIHTAMLKSAQQVHQMARQATCFDAESGQQVPLLDLRPEDLSCHASALSDSAHAQSLTLFLPCILLSSLSLFVTHLFVGVYGCCWVKNLMICSPFCISVIITCLS